MSIQINEASKIYGKQKAVDAISFSAKKGEIIGFLGPNGAGKSTTMKMLTGFLKPSSGNLFVNGIDISKNAIETQKVIGYLPEHNPLYKELYVKEYLQFCAEIHQIKNTKNVISSVIEKVGLTTEAHKKINQLSKGYQQRVGLAGAILHNPSILILDEPTTGLDPNQLVEIRTLIKELGKDKTVLFSTHIMQEVEAVCDRVIIIKKGKIVIDKLLSELQHNNQQIIEVTFDKKVMKMVFDSLKNIDNAINLKENTWQLQFNTKEDVRPKVFDFAQENDLKILELKAINKNLEDLFRELTA
jgi:ABC-2 type transport system ATP-binding protein